MMLKDLPLGSLIRWRKRAAFTNAFVVMQHDANGVRAIQLVEASNPPEWEWFNAEKMAWERLEE